MSSWFRDRPREWILRQAETRSRGLDCTGGERKGCWVAMPGLSTFTRSIDASNSRITDHGDRDLIKMIAVGEIERTVAEKRVRRWGFSRLFQYSS